MVVALAVDVGAGLDEALDDIEMTVLRGPVQRRGMIEPVARVHVETARQQQLDASRGGRGRRPDAAAAGPTLRR